MSFQSLSLYYLWTYEVLAGRTVYMEGELESILKDHYREERERNEWRDTNVTNTLNHLKLNCWGV